MEIEAASDGEKRLRRGFFLFFIFFFLFFSRPTKRAETRERDSTVYGNEGENSQVERDGEMYALRGKRENELEWNEGERKREMEVSCEVTTGDEAAVGSSVHIRDGREYPGPRSPAGPLGRPLCP